MMHRIIPVALALAWFVPTLSRVLADGQLPIRRWAILSDASVRGSGLEELVFAELANADIELVERSGLEAVADELTIQALTSGKSNERSRIGKLLNADALIIISSAMGSTRVTLCECRQGVRLASLNMTIDDAALQAKQLADAIIAASKQFADGVQLVIGVSPFACRNIQHDFDHFQNQYFDFLSSSLLLTPGVTLIEIQEARTLLGELGAGIDVDSRVVPILIDADYKVNDAIAPPSVQIAVKLTTGTASEQFDATLPLDRAGSWIANDLTGKILARSKQKARPLSVVEQKAVLKNRAELFRKLGDVPHAIQCREALLLIDPLNVEQRLQLIVEIQSFEVAQTEHLPSGYSRARSDAQIADQAIRLLLVIEHFSFLIENRLIDRGQAIECLSQMRAGMPSGSLYRVEIDGPKTMGEYCFASDTTKALLDTILAANRRFVFEVAPKILDLDCNSVLTPEADIREQIKWHDNIMWRVSKDVLLHGASIESLEYLEQVVRRIVPEELPTSPVVTRLLGLCKSNYRISAAPVTANTGLGKRNGGVSLQRHEAIFGPPEAEFHAYLQRLRQSQHAHLQFYSRLTLLEIEYSQSGSYTQLIPKYGTLLADVESRPFSQLTNIYGTNLDGVVGNAKQIVKLWGAPQKASPIPQSPAVEPTSMGRLRFANLNVDFGTFGTQPFQWINCDGKFDLLADSQHVAILRGPGKIETIIEISKPGSLPVAQCEWDGKHIWLVHKGGDIGVYDTGGTKVTQIDRTVGLPVHDQDLQVFPIQPDLVLAYGRHGPNERCWLAILEIDDKQRKVGVILDARQTVNSARLTREQTMAMERDKSMSFKPTWFGVCKQGNRQVAYIGRAGSAFPLVVDLNSRTVSPSEGFGRSAAEPTRKALMGSLVCVDDQMFKAFRTGVFHFTLSGPAFEPKLISENFINSIRPVQSNNPSILSGNEVTWTDETPALLRLGEWIYKPGEVWYRFRPDAREVERLVPTRPPRELRGLEYTVSSQYGLVGWKANEDGDKRVFYQIAVE